MANEPPSDSVETDYDRFNGTRVGWWRRWWRRNIIDKAPPYTDDEHEGWKHRG